MPPNPARADAAATGLAHLAAGQARLAVGWLHQALAAQPEHPAAHVNLGTALAQAGDPHGAAAAFQAAIQRAPDHALAHANLGMVLLALGDWAAGWREYEWRWRLPGWHTPHDRVPRWRGAPAAGQTLLLHAEQGFGDTIQFARYAQLATARGLRVIVQAPRPLLRLLHTLPGAAAIFAADEPLPPYDLQCPALSMPLACGTVLANTPAAMCYLRADASAAARWRHQLGGRAPGRLLAGLVWAGNSATGGTASPGLDRRRSVPPALLQPLAALPGVRWVNLQKDAPPAFPMPDPMPAMADFADTAAVVAALDIVVSADTAVAHLAAALGKPVLLMDRAAPCWRWLLGRTTSPWYPTLRIIRQPSPGDWPAVVDGVTQALGHARRRSA